MSLADVHPESDPRPRAVARGPLAILQGDAARKLSARSATAASAAKPSPGSRDTAWTEQAGLQPKPTTLPVVVVCTGASCAERGGEDLITHLRERAAERGDIIVAMTRCLNSCATGPNCSLANSGRLRTGVTVADVEGFAAGTDTETDAS